MAMASPAPPCSPDASPTVEAQATLPDHLTEDILIRLTTAADLARASMAGPSLRRIVADHSFLRRFSALHPPPLLGILSDPFFPAEPPHPSAAAAQTLAGTDLSCSFLPSREQRWRRCDFRDGRALLCIDTDGGAMVRDVAVCDPLHRRYLLLPPVPQGLPDLVHHLDPFLAPAGRDEGADTDTAAGAPFRFKVMCLAQYHTRLVLHVYSSSGPHAGQWRTVTFDGWAALLAGVSDHVRSSVAFGKRYYAHGRFCWPICAINKLLLLDTATTEFSSVDLPPDLLRRDFRDGRALFCVAPDGDDRALVRDVAVCDPLHRRYLLLPPVPQDLSDLVYHCELFLAPAGGDQDTDIAADAPFRFRVMCLAKYQTQLLLFVLSSSGPLAEQWHAVAFDGWSALVAEVSEGDDARSSTALGNRYYAHGCFCWAIPGIGKLLMLDTATMEFSSVDLPPSPWSNSQMAFVEAREGRLGLFALSRNRLLYSISGSIEDDPPRLWLMGAVVPLPLDYAYHIVGVAGGYLLLHGFQDDPESYPSFEMPDPDCFSLNLQTMKLERFCGTELMMPLKNQLLYAGFPPSLSPPTI